MPERNLSATDSQYRALKSFAAKRGGYRMAIHGAMRDRVVEMIVEEWPVGCHPDKIEEVLRARLSIKIKERYGSILAMFLVGVLVNVLVRIALEWWLSRESHRVLMAGWNQNAKQNPNV